jgi:hypothetical protein
LTGQSLSPTIIFRKKNKKEATMRTQFKGTHDAADNRNGRTAAMFSSVENVTEFVSRMSRETPMGDKAAENETRPHCYSAFLATPAWIRTGVFRLSKPWDGVDASKACIDGTWIRTGVFQVTALTGPPTLIGKAGRYNAFLATPAWIRTGVFRLSKPWDGSAVIPIREVFDRTWITTGVFELSTRWRLAEPSEESLRLAA